MGSGSSIGAAGNGDKSNTTAVFGAVDEEEEPFLRLLRRADRSDSGVWDVAEVLDNGCRLRGSAFQSRHWS